MKNRLEIASQLLCAGGCIFISVDDTEQAYLKVLCDEIFGRNNFLSSIAYERSGVSGLGQGGDFIVNTHESILCYSKSRLEFKPVDLSGESAFGRDEMKRYNKIMVSVGEGSPHAKFVAPSTKEEVVIYKHEGYEIATISLRKLDERYEQVLGEYVQNFEQVFRNTSIQEENGFQNKILAMCKDGLYSAKYLVSRGKNKGQVLTAYYLNGGVFVWLKDSAMVQDGKIVKTNKLSDFWDHASIPKADLANEGGVKLRRGKKPENLLKRFMTMVTKPGDLVLDFFSGSGTTCAVAHKMGRQYIGIEQLQYGDNDTVVRLQNVIRGDKTGISKSASWEGGGEFVACELMKYNEAFMERIEAAKSSKELVKIWKEMAEQSFLNWYVNPKVPEEAVKDFESLGKDEDGLKKQKHRLSELLDKNQLYVNLSEIDDARFKVSDEDKALNKAFYSEAYIV
jgi:adenine-specific DNA-methyltransferase